MRVCVCACVRVCVHEYEAMGSTLRTGPNVSNTYKNVERQPDRVVSWAQHKQGLNTEEGTNLTAVLDPKQTELKLEQPREERGLDERDSDF